VITSAAQAGTVQEDNILIATGTVVATDVDYDATMTYSGNADGTYGSFAVNASTGVWTYALNNAAQQNLAQGESHSETFNVTVTDDKGATAIQAVVMTITGSNDAPVITSAAQAGAVQEDSALTATGTVVSTDVDHLAIATYSGNTVGTYGSFAVNASSGVWTYALDNGIANVQALAAGEHASDSFVVRVTDDQGAFVDHAVTVDLTGSNDAAIISGSRTGVVTEDTAPITTGTLTVVDVDHGQAVFQAQTGVAGSYGSFSIGVDGNWTYA
ncbi:VCBS domain-containing protein, partial [bacterium]|nr:VCBS domain-containing protein [bacterium]